MSQVFLVEDHDEVLKIWKKQNIKGLDLVHLDAHIDFGFFPAKPPEKLLTEAKSLKDLKNRLEYMLNFLHYEKNFNKQINIGNYVYPAIYEGIVNNFYWVVPGESQEFKDSAKTIKRILKNIKAFEDNKKAVPEEKTGVISTKCLRRKLFVCNLDNLPEFNNPVLLDIDVDFLVIGSVLEADNSKMVGKRKPWILPKVLLDLLKQKINTPQITTISYSVNGGYTPIIYKHLGDELAFRLSPPEFRRKFEIEQKAARYFNLFYTSGKKEYYQSAIKLNPMYRCPDNNYGPLYLAKMRFLLAGNEFTRILRVDKRNAGAMFGLGEIALKKRDFKKAKQLFSSALKFTNYKLFNKIRKQVIFGLARTEFNLRNFHRAKELLMRYRASEPMQPYSYYLLGRIFEKEKAFTNAARFYKDAIRLGFGDIETLSRLLGISFHLQEKNDTINYLNERFKEFKTGFMRMKRLYLKKGRKIRGLKKIEKKMDEIGNRLAKT